MRKYAYVYVGKPARANFAIGMDKRTWGWKLDTHGPDVGIAMSTLRNPESANYVVFAQGMQTTEPPQGWPRTPANDPAWTRAHLNSITLAQVTRPLRQESGQLWPDDLYPYRISLGSPVKLPSFGPGELSPDVIFVIRNALLQRGLPVLGPAPVDETDVPVDEGMKEEEPVPDRLLGDMDGLDGLTRALFRREQTWLRRKAFGQADFLRCGLCHRDLPVSLLRLAHIKRRTDATIPERLNTANTMPACTLGCDELFERGYVVVDSSGRIRRNVAAPTVTADLDVTLSNLDGRTVLGYGVESAPFFAAHTVRHSRLGEARS